MINPKNICKYIALIIIVSILSGVFLPSACIAATGDESAVNADENTAAPNGKTQIQSVIPYVEKTENGAPKNVPVESADDMKLNPDSVYLKAQVYLNAADAAKYYGSQVYIFKLLPYQEITDISSATPAADFNVQSSEGFSYNVNMPAPDLADFSSAHIFNKGEIFNKFVAGVKDGNLYVPITDAQYISNINCLAGNGKREVPPVTKTKKGLMIQMPGEARILGVEYTTVTIYLNDLMAAEEGPNTELYVYQNQNYYFNRDKFLEYDKKIKYFTNEGINVTAVLLINAAGFTPSGQTVQTQSADGSVTADSLVPANPVEYLIHPNALPPADGGGVKPFYYGINTKDERGVRYFEALMSFIADRYVEKDIGFGRVYNIILGSDIGRLMYNYCGKTDMTSYIKDYIRALRICDTAVRSRFGGGRVYVPFDNWFTAKSQTEGDFTFKNKDVIDSLCDYSQKEGNFIWNIAWSAYNADILNPACWNETAPLNDYSTPVITMKNIKILCDYINLEKKDYLPNGELRKVMLFDQGFSSGDNSIENRDIQAASFVYAYLKARYTPDITAFIYRGQVDNANEIGSFGLWTNAPGTVNEPGEHKKIYDVFRYMDTNKEADKTEFAKAVLGVTDFTEITPQYSPDSAPAVTLTEVSGETIKNAKSLTATNIGIFRDDKLSGFNGTSNISTISRADYKNPDLSGFDGDSMLFTGFKNPVKGDFGGIYKTYASALNLKDEKYVGVKLRIDTDIAMPEEQKIQMLLIMESEPQSQNAGATGETTGAGSGAPASSAQSSSSNAGAAPTSVFEGLANISPNKDEIVYFDISSWDDRTNINKIKLLVNPYAVSSGYAGANGGTEGLPVQTAGENAGEPGLSAAAVADNKYDFNLYIYSIVSAHTSRMSSFQTILTVVVIAVCIAAAEYTAWFIRARMIKKRRRELELQRRRQAKAAASRRNAQPQANNQSNYRQLPPRNPPPRKPPGLNSSPNSPPNQTGNKPQTPSRNRIPPNNNPNSPNNPRPRNINKNDNNNYDNTGKK